MSQRRYESPDVGAACARMLRGLVDRAREGDTQALEELATLERTAGAALTVAMDLAHREAGYSWTQVADALGTSRQAARQRGELRVHLVPAGLRAWFTRATA